MKNLLAFLALVVAVPAVAQIPGCIGAQAYFVSATGSDSDTGLTGHAWLTGAHAGLQQSNGTIQPGSTITLGTLHDTSEVDIINSTTVTSSTTTPAILPASGSAACPITWLVGSGYVNDAADIIAPGTITNVGSGVYSFVVSQLPLKIYVDDNNADEPQLLPVPNARGQYSNTATYNAYDMPISTILNYVTDDGSGTGMTVGATGALVISGLSCGTAQPTGTFTVKTATTVSYTVVATGDHCTGTPTITAATGGTPPVITGTMYSLEHILANNVFNQVGVAPGTNGGYPWLKFDNNTQFNSPTTLNDSAKFSSTNTGLQNVTATPGSWWLTPSGSNWIVYVHLTGGDSPASHVLKATHRNYNFYLSGVDYTQVIGNGILEHASKRCWYNIASPNSQAGGNYWSGEYNMLSGLSQAQPMQVFGCANVGLSQDLINSAVGGRYDATQGAVVFRPGGETDPHFLRHTMPLTQYVRVGTIDDYYGGRGNSDAGFIVSGIDGTNGGLVTSCTPAICGIPASWGDTWATTNTSGYIYGATGLSLSTLHYRNIGGGIMYGTCTNTTECAAVTTSGPFRGAYNNFHDAKAEGWQMGGDSISSTALPVILDHNVVSNFGLSPTTVGYNCVDTNGVASNLNFPYYLINNTFFNCTDSGVTFEGNSGGQHVWNNAISENAFITQYGTNVWTGPGNGYAGHSGSGWLYYVGVGVTAITVGTPGSGMTPGPYTLTIAPPPGGSVASATQATGTAVVASDGVTVTATVTARGDYTSAPAITWSPSGTPAVLVATVPTTNSRLNADWQNNGFDAACATVADGCASAFGRLSCVAIQAFYPMSNNVCEGHPPMFVNAQGGPTSTTSTPTYNDFRLQSASSYRNAGASLCIQGICTTPDIGAIPYGQPATFTAPTYVPPGTLRFQVLAEAASEPSPLTDGSE